MLMNTGRTSADVVVTSTHDLVHEGTVFARVFNFNGGGFAIVSADDVAVPVIMYTGSGSYGSATEPPAFTEMMRMAGTEILAAVADGTRWGRGSCCGNTPAVNGRRSCRGADPPPTIRSMEVMIGRCRTTCAAVPAAP